jgi:uncharacterized glyoxalase superfamily protein PhnB
LEPLTLDGSARLMIDSVKLMSELIGEAPRPGNHSAFAIQCVSPSQVDAAAARVQTAGFNVVQAPWEAFWGQRYCVVQGSGGLQGGFIRRAVESLNSKLEQASTGGLV